jgi:hypothetical protein
MLMELRATSDSLQDEPEHFNRPDVVMSTAFDTNKELLPDVALHA